MTDRSLAVWAPDRQRVRLVVDGPGGGVMEMVRTEDGWWVPEPDEREHVARILAEAYVDYGFVLDEDGHDYPDPRSRRQYDVHGMSRTYDASTFTWTDQSWTGRQLAGSVIY
ncbi:MAG TPA: malto-oligosyltrehalose trehalohydrolase, partial [Nocardioides sp.]|nr:malto-oligosyltrehalose trehalohydrolase [Nocardioides sp.]